jgi:hypothetical protein
LRAKCRTWNTFLLFLCLALVGSESALAQDAPSCGGSDWFVVQQNQLTGSSRLSLLCKGELDAAEDNRKAAETALGTVIADSPQSGEAYAAHSTLAHFYFRIGRFRDANDQILAMLVARPTAPDLLNVRSLFALLTFNPDFTIASSAPANVSTHVIDGNVFAPLTIDGSARAYVLDTGLNLSMMSESEAKSLGLTPQTSTTSLTDISGLASSSLRIVHFNPRRVWKPFLLLPARFR